jgi:hypothetical protein
MWRYALEVEVVIPIQTEKHRSIETGQTDNCYCPCYYIYLREYLLVTHGYSYCLVKKLHITMIIRLLIQLTY